VSAILAPEERLIWSESAMTEAVLARVCAEVRSRTRPVVVECGSGFSTLTLAGLPHERQGAQLSLEHDPLWATRVRRNLDAAGLAGTAQSRSPRWRHTRSVATGSAGTRKPSWSPCRPGSTCCWSTDRRPSNPNSSSAAIRRCPH
jgi:hypothetical protein